MLWKRIRARVRRELYGPPPLIPEPKFLAQNPVYDRYDVGDWTYGRPFIDYMRPGRKLTIGRFCSIGPEVEILLGGNHSLDTISTFPFKELIGGDESVPGMEFSRGDITIGNDVLDWTRRPDPVRRHDWGRRGRRRWGRGFA